MATANSGRRALVRRCMASQLSASRMEAGYHALPTALLSAPHCTAIVTLAVSNYYRLLCMQLTAKSVLGPHTGSRSGVYALTLEEDMHSTDNQMNA